MFIIIDFAKAFRILASIFVLILILVFTTTAYAATVNRTKNKAVEIQMDRDDDLVKGDTVYALSSKGKKIGKISIVKIKGKKAIGKLTKGKAPKGASILMPTGKESEPE